MRSLNKNIKIKLERGLSLPLTILFSFLSSGLLFAYITNIYQKELQLDFEIARVKAEYNAESGIALGVYKKMYLKDYILSSADSLQNVPIEGMGNYSVGAREGQTNGKPHRTAYATGYAYVRKLGGGSVEVTANKKIRISNDSSLSDFLYLTESEKAGGAPWSFDNGNPSFSTRRNVTWGGNDNLNSGWGNGDPVCEVGFQTNGTFEMSSFGAPTFDICVSITEDENGVNSPILNGQSESQVFNGDCCPEIPNQQCRKDTLPPVCLPPPGYEQMKRIIEGSNRYLTLDATQKLNWNSGFTQRDTLIMTDIEFFVEGQTHGFRYKQFWFLKPPYLQDLLNGFESPFILNSNAVGNTLGQCDPISQTSPTFDVRGCDNYVESMENFHSRTIDLTDGSEETIPPDNWGIVSGTYGFHHYDFPDLYAPGGWTSQFEIDQDFPSGMPDHLLSEYVAAGGYKEVLLSNLGGGNDMAIYVKGGPVRVKGTYKGRYTIVTDEFTTYRRHAHGINVAGINPIDTLWNNIWIVDDIVNTDGNAAGSLLSAQPDLDDDGNLDCATGSSNTLGLVSGANVFIANTTRNGARDCNNSNNDDFCNIDIHAHIIAFNESFAAHYSNNTYSSAGGNPWTNPPFGDGQGILRFGPSNNDDTRGTITLWGGVVQKYRGYVVRNFPGPYNLPAGNIGYPSKQYNFDCNLKCNYPPLYPENATCNGEESEELQWYIDTYE